MNTNENPLGTKPTNELLRQFAIPSIIAMLVTSLYNIVDQLFIGQAVGELGNAATNVCFPLTTLCISLALCFGIGSASSFNLAMGEGKKDIAGFYVGNAVTMMLIIGVALMAVVLLFKKPLLVVFGSPDEVLPYAMTYAGITAFGFPACILQAGGAHIIRADGSPRITMLVNIVGAVINTVLDALFVFGFHMGIAGAAYATIIGQYVSAVIVIIYLTRYKTVRLTKEVFIPKFRHILRVVSLGVGPFFNQISFLVVQITLNNSLRHYGAISKYGESIPIAVAGIVMKVTQVAGAFVIGVSQGLQPIASFNYGAKKYSRVKAAYLLAIKYGAIICVIAFTIFQVFPRQILSAFGNGSDEYFEFGIRFMRVFIFCFIVFFMQPMSSNFFTAIGKPKMGVFMSLTRQIIFFVPLLIILPLFFGLDGIIYSGPAADGTAFVVCLALVLREFSHPEWKEISAY